jgi:hypothetical protein
MDLIRSVLRSSLVSIMLAVALMVSPVVIPQDAVAQIGINIGVGNSLNHGRGITCRQGERLLRNRGFRDVHMINCRGTFFNYRATRNGERFEISIRQRDGRIVEMRRISRRR